MTACSNFAKLFKKSSINIDHEMPKDILDMEDFLQSGKFSLTPHSVWKLSM